MKKGGPLLPLPPSSHPHALLLCRIAAPQTRRVGAQRPSAALRGSSSGCRSGRLSGPFVRKLVSPLLCHPPVAFFTRLGSREAGSEALESFVMLFLQTFVILWKPQIIDEESGACSRDTSLAEFMQDCLSYKTCMQGCTRHKLKCFAAFLTEGAPMVPCLCSALLT